MGRLVYAVIASLDGYTVDAEGDFSWCAPDDEVHAFLNDLERGIGTYLYGRRMYQVMRYWQTLDLAAASPVAVDYAQIWQATDKVVYSSTLTTVDTPRTRLEHDLDPGAVRRLVDASDADVAVGGPTIAAPLLRAGLVDELHQVLAPVVVGGGTPALPDDLRLGLQLVSTREFASGFVHLHHRVRR